MINDFISASEYSRRLFKENEKIKKIKENALANKVPIITEEVLAHMLFMAKLINAKNCLEIGTAVGYSTFYLAQNMKVTSIEIDNERHLEAKKNLKELLVDANLILGDALDEIPKLNEKYDFIFIDAAKGQYRKFFDLCYEKLNNNGLIYIDNILFKSYVGSDDYPKRYKTIVKNLEEFIIYLNEQKSFVLLPFGDGVGIVRKD